MSDAPGPLTPGRRKHYLSISICTHESTHAIQVGQLVAVPHLKRGTMSHDATSWARACKTGSMSAKFVLMRLADYAGTDYSCYPSVRKLADECEMSESTVRAATKLLAETGLIRVFYRHRPDGSRRSSRYQLLVEGPDTMLPDADDWADHRRISADAMRQNPAGAPAAADGGPRRDLAVIPLTEPSPVEPSPVTPRASRSERATRVPDDFTPDENMRAWYAAEKLEQTIDGRVEHQKFMNYWQSLAGPKAKKLDWSKTWMNWMLTAAERSGRRPSTALAPVSGAPYRPSTTDQKVAQTLELGRRLQAMEESK
jgi:helix-turn-helix protein